VSRLEPWLPERPSDAMLEIPPGSATIVRSQLVTPPRVAAPPVVMPPPVMATPPPPPNPAGLRDTIADFPDDQASPSGTDDSSSLEVETSDLAGSVTTEDAAPRRPAAPDDEPTSIFWPLIFLVLVPLVLVLGVMLVWWLVT
jgi:hypothetical protein